MGINNNKTVAKINFKSQLYKINIIESLLQLRLEESSFSKYAHMSKKDWNLGLEHQL